MLVSYMCFGIQNLSCLCLRILRAPWAQDPGPRSDDRTDCRTVGLSDGRSDGRTVGWVVGRSDGWSDGWTVGRSGCRDLIVLQIFSVLSKKSVKLLCYLALQHQSTAPASPACYQSTSNCSPGVSSSSPQPTYLRMVHPPPPLLPSMPPLR